MKVDVSIIVPVFNVEDYLRQCLDSLCNQTLKNIEIIIVNDGSTDDSLSIVNEYAIYDHRVVVINKENGGLSSARNVGLKMATGDYIAFLDSDDWVEAETYQVLYDTAVENGSDIVTCGFFMSYADRCVPKPILDKNLYNININKNIEYYSKIRVASWDKLYLRSLFIDNNIQYPDGLLYEDTPTTIPLLLCSKRVSFLKDCYIHYRQRPGSITKSITFNPRSFDIYKGLNIIENFINNKNELNAGNNSIIYNYLFIKKCVIDNYIKIFLTHVDLNYHNTIILNFKSKKSISLHNPLLTFKERLIAYVILNFNCYLVRVIFKCFYGVRKNNA